MIHSSKKFPAADSRAAAANPRIEVQATKVDEQGSLLNRSRAVAPQDRRALYGYSTVCSLQAVVLRM
jgi:hypothetical protein